LKGLGNTAKPSRQGILPTMGVGGMTFFLLIVLASEMIQIFGGKKLK
jgi:hypothetical protein